MGQLTGQLERLRTSIRAEVERPFGVIKRQFGQVKVRHPGLEKNTAQLYTLFALSNLWMARGKLLVLDGYVRPRTIGSACNGAESARKRPDTPWTDSKRACRGLDSAVRDGCTTECASTGRLRRPPLSKKVMTSNSPVTKWAVYEANVQQYRVLSATVQSFFLTVGSILFTQQHVPNFLMLMIAVLAILHVRFVWFDVVKARHLIIDYYKFQHYAKLTAGDLAQLADKYPETRYVHDAEARREVNAKFFRKPGLRLWRETRLKLDVIVPTAYVIIWIGLLAWKQPWQAPLW